MDKFGEALANFPDLAPGIVVGTLVGMAFGIRKDIKAGEAGNWWQLGGIGFALGAVAWFAILILA